MTDIVYNSKIAFSSQSECQTEPCSEHVYTIPVLSDFIHNFKLFLNSTSDHVNIFVDNKQLGYAKGGNILFTEALPIFLMPYSKITLKSVVPFSGTFEIVDMNKSIKKILHSNNPSCCHTVSVHNWGISSFNIENGFAVTF